MQSKQATRFHITWNLASCDTVNFTSQIKKPGPTKVQMARLLTPPSPDQPESKQTKPFPLLTDSSKDLKKKILVTLCYPALNVKQYHNRSPEKCKFWKVHRTFQDLDPVQSHFDVTSQAQKESFSNPSPASSPSTAGGGGAERSIRSATQGWVQKSLEKQGELCSIPQGAIPWGKAELLRQKRRGASCL